MSARSRSPSRWFIPLAAAVLTAAACSADPGTPEIPSAEDYLGKWNYDRPDPAAMTNMAVLHLPTGTAQAPQIGDIVVTRDPAAPDTHLIGRTDVGCTWRFRLDPDALRLDPPAQLCNNPTSHVSYTITAWTATVSGDRMTEVFSAKSHRADRDLDFALEKGARTRTTESDPAAAPAFVGAWTFAPTHQGTLTVTADFGNRITAVTGDGCQWTLLARGNTAKLDPPVQTCPRSDGGTETLTSWTIAAAGDHLDTIMIGVHASGAAFTIGAGSLTKS
ncbi:hypothetical protein JK358_32070 [Nocardia sp. 2]|uniref:META domain-containing protein n=1 Tax=Nocardia acididurans TaxID=2802282 RepID=A0ABS1MG74_9NOCA|nr:hypothetical protein [Nocardia acididurans]MBL1079050.1 hypothetical protein [Nocardia acididurans]